MTFAKALWIVGHQQIEMRDTAYQINNDDIEVQTLFTGISRGTERLVFSGQVPTQEYATMRAPFQEGTFPFPVKYGYAAVGRVKNGLRKDTLVFALFPHQTRFAVPPDMAIAIPENVPAKRAVLAANMETALNIIWDANISAGDRVIVIGCGVVGALVGYLSAQIPGTDVTLVDINPSRNNLAETMGCAFATPDQIAGEADVLIHASANAAGLALAIDLAAVEARVIEASWYGTVKTDVPLGGRFHRCRLQLVSSQVGRIPPRQAARWTYRRRLSKALQLLADPVLDALISGETAFDLLTENYANILKDPATLCHCVRYDV